MALRIQSCVSRNICDLGNIGVHSRCLPQTYIMAPQGAQ